jgi:iron complex outermembrane receptor protein
LGAIAIGPGFSGGPARAADAADASSAESATLQEIVVTAQRRTENLQIVPIAVTAISPTQIHDLNIVTLKDIQLVTPGLTFESGYNFAQPFIRGVGTSNPTPGVESAVATYIDGAYVERAEAQITDLFDVAGVQVLKGAQGTLWGRNASGGAIIYTTNDPGLNAYSTSVNAEYGSYNHVLGEVVTNIPLSDTLAVRLGGHFVHEDGYITNLVGGPKLGGRQSGTLRGKIKWQPTEQFSAVLAVDGFKGIDRNNAQREVAAAPLCAVCSIPGSGAGPVARFYDVAQDLTATPFYTSASNATLHLNYAGDRFATSSVTYYRYDFTTVTVDEGLSPFPLFDYGAQDGGKSLGQEFQASTDFSGMFNALAGVSYLYDDSHDGTNLTGLSFAALLPIFGSQPYAYNDVLTKSYAGFAELYATPLEHLKLTVGGRYTADSRTLTGRENAAANAALAPPGAPATWSEHATFNKFTPRVVAAYDLGEVNVYASWNRGFKAGGYNTPTFSSTNVVNPESIDNYEIGAKYESADRRLRLNAAAFYYTYSDIQVNIVSITTGGQILQNAAGARGKGAELDGNYQATSWLTAFGSAAYLHARYTSYPNASIVNPTAIGLAQGTADLTGQPLTRSPSFNGTVGFSVHAPVTEDWLANLSVVGRYTTRYYFYPDAGGPVGHDVQPGYGIVNISGDLEHQAAGAGSRGIGLKAYKIGYYVKNATNKKYYQLRGTSAGLGEYEQVAAPITVGLRLSADF